MVTWESNRSRDLEVVVGTALNTLGAPAGCQPLTWEIAAEIGTSGGFSGAAHNYSETEIPRVLRTWADLLGLTPVIPPSTGGGTVEYSGLVENALFLQVWGVIDTAFFDIAGEL